MENRAGKENGLRRMSPESDAHCVYKNVARLFAEEPQLEAVAFEPKNRKLSIATLGKDLGKRIADRVSEMVADRETQCGLLNESGVCAQCGESPARKVGDANAIVKDLSGTPMIEKLTCSTAVSFRQWKTLRWPRPDCCGNSKGNRANPNEWKWLAMLAGLCLIFGLAGFAVLRSGGPFLLALGFFAVSYLTGAWDAAGESWTRLRRRELEIHFLMIAVAVGAAAVDAWSEGAVLLFLFSTSGAMERYAGARTQREISALLRGAPKVATVLEEGAEVERAVELLAAGMEVRVRAGDQVPVDLRVQRGDSACDESNLTGEARPMPKQPGDLALAGTMNLWGVLEGKVLRPANESALQKIINLIEQAQDLKAPSQRFSDRFGTGYTYLVLIASLVFFLAGWLVFGWPIFYGSGGRASAFYRAMTLLVVMSPCALVLSVPSAVLSAIASGARRGVLFRGGAAIETLAEVKTVALDKTGTLTRGEHTLAEVEMFAGDEGQLLTIAYNLARLSHHPLSRAIQKLGAQRGLRSIELTNVKSFPGSGIQGRDKGLLYSLGNREFMRSTIMEHFYATATEPENDTAEVWIAGPDLCGRLLLRDELRPEARGMLEELRRFGVRSVVVTGDREETARAIGEEAGADVIRSRLSPEDKVRTIEELKVAGSKVAMIGDGVNDAPCLAAADVGVAMGARGSDAALEQAEVVLMNDRLENFMSAYHLSRRAKRVIRQNITIALGTVLIMALLALTRGIPLALGVVAHEGSTIVVVLNSLRLLFVDVTYASKNKSVSRDHRLSSN